MAGTFLAKGSGYLPSPGNGGLMDRHEMPLHTLEDFLQGNAEYVSTAMDKNLNVPYGAKLRIPELENRYGKEIEFRVVDTEEAFKNKGYTRIDICVRDRMSSLDPALNNLLTLNFS